MITYLKDSKEYEDRYDRETVEIGREEVAMLESTFLEPMSGGTEVL